MHSEVALFDRFYPYVPCASFVSYPTFCFDLRLPPAPKEPSWRLAHLLKRRSQQKVG